MADWITCEICSSRFEKDKSLRLTEWKEEVDEDTEWCCLICTSKAFKRG